MYNITLLSLSLLSSFQLSSSSLHLSTIHNHRRIKATGAILLNLLLFSSLILQSHSTCSRPVGLPVFIKLLLPTATATPFHFSKNKGRTIRSSSSTSTCIHKSNLLAFQNNRHSNNSSTSSSISDNNTSTKEFKLHSYSQRKHNMNTNPNTNTNTNTRTRLIKDNEKDAQAYNHYISQSVDINENDVYERKGYITFMRSCRDIDSNTKRKFMYTYNHLAFMNIASRMHLLNDNDDDNHYLNNNGGDNDDDNVNQNQYSKNGNYNNYNTNMYNYIPMMMTPPIEIESKIKARIVSPSGNKIAIFITEPNTTNTSNNKRSNKHIVEIWTHQGMKLSKRIILPIDKVHGQVCFDFSWFGNIAWNNDESALVYSAEMKHPKTSSYFDEKNNSHINNNDNNSCYKLEEGEEEETFIGDTNRLGYGKGEDWGEKYTSTCRLNLYILNVYTGKVGLVTNVPKSRGRINDLSKSTDGGYTFGQAIFSPCGNHIIYTGWDAGSGGASPKRLGSIYCYQRPSKIYSSSVRQLLVTLASTSSGERETSQRPNSGSNKFLDAIVVDDPYICITPYDRLARSPRFGTNNPEKGIYNLVYLCNPRGFDTHGGAMALHAVDWHTIPGKVNGSNGLKLQNKRILVDVVALPTFDNTNGHDDETKVLGMSFPGLFLNQLPSSPFTPDGKYLITTVQWGSITKIIKISMDDGDVKAINFNLLKKESFVKNDTSQSILCITSKGDAVVSQSHPSLPTVLGIIPSSYLTDTECKIKSSLLLPILDSISASTKFDCFRPKSNNGSTCHLVSITPNHGVVRSIVQGILTIPTDENGEELKNVPLIVVPHGGPHSCFSASYIPSYAYLCEHGRYALLQVNYRGSTGFGQTPLESLAGHVGSQDIGDIVQLTNRVLTTYKGIIDSSRVGIVGGSHGGFLSGHAIGQFPQMFKVAAMRNPVTNIATMVTTTDIPDWCYVETMGTGKYDWSKFKGPTADELSRMWKASRK